MLDSASSPLTLDLSLKHAVLAGIVATLLYIYIRGRRRSSLYPPSPPASFFGYTAIPATYPWLKYEEWAAKYGEIVMVRRGPFSPPLVLLNTAAAAADVLDRQGAKTSDRPKLYVARDVLCGNLGILLEGYNNAWRKMRKAVHNQLMPKMAAYYGGMSEAASRNVIRDNLKNPADFMLHFKKYAASLSRSMTYGKRTPTTYDDPELQIVHKFNRHLINACRPGGWLVETVPVLKYLPGYLDVPRALFKEELALYRMQRQRVLDEMKDGSAPPSFVRFTTEQQRTYQLDDDMAAWVAGSLFSAGSDSTVGQLQAMVLAALAFPDKQKNAQEELDQVVGKDRSPTFGDMDSLPYCQAFAEEVLRWRPIAASGFVHRASEDVYYKGYLIPKDAHIAGVVWNINREAGIFDHPDVFQPERFLEKHGDHLKLVEHINHAAWGHGRRICPGLHVAARSIFINTAQMLWAFDILPPEGREAKDVDTRMPSAFQPIGFPFPKPFDCQLRPRIPHLQDLLGDEDEQMWS